MLATLLLHCLHPVPGDLHPRTVTVAPKHILQGRDAAVKAAVYPKGWSAKKITLNPNPFTIWPYYTDDGGWL